MHRLEGGLEQCKSDVENEFGMNEVLYLNFYLLNTLYKSVARVNVWICC